MAFICVLTAIPAAASSLPPCSIATRYELCDNDSIAKAGRALAEAGASLGEAIGANLKILKTNLDQARAQVFSGHLSGAQLQQAQLRLDSLLMQKDFYLCLVDVLIAPGGRPVGSGFNGALAQMSYRNFADFDGGIPAFARSAYITWNNEIEHTVDAQGSTSSLATLIARYTLAMQSTGNTYRTYAMARDWGEYAAAGRNVSDDPKEYLTTLIMLKTPRSSSNTSDPPSADYYAELVLVFGQEAISKVTRDLMNAPKNHDGDLAPPYRSDGSEYEDLMSAMWAQLGDTGPRAYALEQFATAGDHERLRATLDDLRTALTKYQALASAQGETALLRAAKIVHDAPKTPRGVLIDPRALGANAQLPRNAIEQIAAGSTQTASAAGGPANPDYAAWAGFKVGASVIYADSDDLGGGGRWIQIAHLQSLDSKGATVLWRRFQFNERADPTHQLDSTAPVTIPAQITAAEPSDAPTPERAPGTSGGKSHLRHLESHDSVSQSYVAPSATGTETLKINGKLFECQWEKRGNTYTWTSKEIPGGLVMSTADIKRSLLVVQLQLTDPDAIHAIRELRFDVQSVSGGPYKDMQTPPKRGTVDGVDTSVAPVADSVTHAAPVAATIGGPVPNSPPGRNDLAQPPLTTHAPTVQLQDVIGTYSGTYRCGSANTAVQLKVSIDSHSNLRGVFAASIPGLPPYDLVGIFTPGGSHQFYLNALRWESRPLRGYRMVGMRGNFEPSGRSLRGKITDPTCGDFFLQRADP